MRTDILACPNCKNPIDKKPGIYQCRSCLLRYSAREGAVDFLGDAGYYWGEISPNRMKKVLKRARRAGWKKAVAELIYEYPGMEEYLLNHGRIDWLFHCLDSKKSNSCLDIGSGWGSLSFDLTEYYDHVYSLESVKERVEFQAIRKEQEKAKRLHLVRANFLELPFKRNSFDLVVVSGVLEWIGVGSYKEDPHTLQVKFLREIRRILKPGGCVYIGIENRFGLHYWLGAKDHSGLPLTSIIPRPLADIAVRNLRKTGGEYSLKSRMQKEDWPNYRTYTYTLYGYNKLLLETGFKNVDAYWTLFYSNPKFSGPINGDNFKFFLRFLANNTDGRVGSVGPLLANIGKYLPSKFIETSLRALSPSFLLYGYKGRRNPTHEDNILKIDRPNSTFLKMGGSSGYSSKITYFLLDKALPVKVVKFPRFMDASKDLAREEKLATKFGNIDKPILNQVDKVPVFVEEPIAGRTIDSYSFQDNERAINWLLNFQTNTERRGNLYNLVAKEYALMKRFLKTLPINKTLENKIERRISEFLELLQQSRLPITAVHGDFCFMNILLKNKKSEVVVLDWEDFSEKGNPLTDFVFFILHNLSKDKEVGNLIEHFKGRGPQFSTLYKLIARFSDHYEISKKVVVSAVPYVALNLIHEFSRGKGKHLGHTSYYLNLLKKWGEIDPKVINRVWS